MNDWHRETTVENQTFTRLFHDASLSSGTAKIMQCVSGLRVSTFSAHFQFCTNVVVFLQEILHFHNITMLLIKLSTVINIPEFVLVYLKNHQRLGYIILKCSSRQYVGKKMHFVLIFSILHLKIMEFI